MSGRRAARAAVIVLSLGLAALAQAPSTHSATQPATQPGTQPARPVQQSATQPAPPPTTQPSAPPASAPASQAAPAPAPPTTAPALAVHSGDLIAFLGDELTDTPTPSQTESFPMLVETFLSAKHGDLKIRTLNAGWEGDTAARALLRLQRDVLVHKPDVVVICLGLNDPEYQPVSDDRLAAYRAALKAIIEQCQAAGARVWVITPPSVDEALGRKVRARRNGEPAIGDLAAVQYNQVLARYAAAAMEVAAAAKVGAVDWFGLSMATRQAHASNPAFALSSNGLNMLPRTHALVAAALLEAWGARPIEVLLRVDWAAGTATIEARGLPAGAQPKVRAELTPEGRRILHVSSAPLPWPMLSGPGPDWEAARMSRWVLAVAGPPTRGLNVTFTWASGSTAIKRPLTAEQAAGCNLAALDPFRLAGPVREFYQLIATKNQYQYSLWHRLARTPPREPELVEAHGKFMEAWTSYVRGHEALINRFARTFSLDIVLSEAVPPEQLPTAPPPASLPAPPASAPAPRPPASAPAPASAPVPPGSAPAAPAAAAPASAPA